MIANCKLPKVRGKVYPHLPHKSCPVCKGAMWFRWDGSAWECHWNGCGPFVATGADRLAARRNATFRFQRVFFKRLRGEI